MREYTDYEGCRIRLTDERRGFTIGITWERASATSTWLSWSKYKRQMRSS
jgi:hypothetical protein